MDERGRSPQILHVEWGKMDVAGLALGKDMKLWPGGGRRWDWGETGTRHVPGIQIADVRELCEQGAEVIVLSRGMELVLQTCPETLAHLREIGIPVHVLETREAVELYNRLVLAGERAGGLFHSTC
ncbi:MAG: Mth938-like domain-containing protein [Acidobacteriota bacterium]